MVQTVQDSDTVTRDPVCGMAVDPAAGKPRFEHEGRVFHFCREGCRDTFAADPEAYIEAEEDRIVPEWLDADPERFRGEVKALPTRDDVSIQINEQLIVEFCSR